jgi:hypothetical protein
VAHVGQERALGLVGGLGDLLGQRQRRGAIGHQALHARREFGVEPDDRGLGGGAAPNLGLERAAPAQQRGGEQGQRQQQQRDHGVEAQHRRFHVQGGHQDREHRHRPQRQRDETMAGAGFAPAGPERDAAQGAVPEAQRQVAHRAAELQAEQDDGQRQHPVERAGHQHDPQQSPAQRRLHGHVVDEPDAEGEKQREEQEHPR